MASNDPAWPTLFRVKITFIGYHPGWRPWAGIGERLWRGKLFLQQLTLVTEITCWPPRLLDRWTVRATNVRRSNETEGIKRRNARRKRLDGRDRGAGG